MERKNLLNSLPDEYKPLSAWAYFGLGLLFSVPLVGWVFLFIFAFSNRNINRRNFARSYFCIYVLLLILIGVVILLNLFVPAVSDVVTELTETAENIAVY